MSDMSQYFPQIFPINVSILVVVKQPESVRIFFNLRGSEALVVLLHPVWSRGCDCCLFTWEELDREG